MLFVKFEAKLTKQYSMKISSSWLHEFIPVQKTPQELEQLLTDTGLEVEGFEEFESIKGGLKGVVVAEVVSCEKHPNADRLKVTTVNNGSEVLQVVCGAPNVAVGQKVALAQIGATLYPSSGEPMKMKLSKIRDVESHGMLCAEDELGLSGGHDGILVLPNDIKVGTPLAEYLNTESDVQIEIGLTPNRADALGHIGIARDVIAYTNCHEGTHAKLELKPVNELNITASNFVNIQVENTEKCPRYVGITLTNVHVQQSPSWLQNRLKAVGVNPINNIVDVTNYVMRELGTPLHAFDADFVGKDIIVRTARAGEKITTLDDVERTLDTEDLVIANSKEAMCIAGVFGGKKSGIHSDTKNIFLEAAFFQPVSVRKTAKRHSLSTDASFRFERGVDIDLIPYALKRAAQLIQKIAGGEVGMEPMDIYPVIQKKRSVSLRFNRLNAILGHTIPSDIVVSILTSLDFEISAQTDEKLELLVPNYRIDVDREIDVIEEVLRIYGFNLIPLPEKLNTSLVVSEKPDMERLMVSLADFLSGMGFIETLNNSLTSPSYSEKLAESQYPLSKAVHLLNPLSQDLAVMRQSLVFQALEVIAYNQNRQASNVKLFEFGKSYQHVEGKYLENNQLVLAGTGKKSEENWSNSAQDFSFFTLKGVVQNVFSKLGLDGFLMEEELDDQQIFEDGLKLRILKDVVGEIGWISPKILKHFGIKQAVFVADIDWSAVVRDLKLTKTQYKELPKTFEVRRDFSLLLNNSVKFSEIAAIAKKTNKNLLQKVGLFDVYEGKNLPEGKKSYAVSFVFQDAESTLKDSQIDQIMAQIRSALESQLHAELR